MTHDEIFKQIKEKTFNLFGLKENNIHISFYSNCDLLFQESDIFKNFLTKYNENKTNELFIQSVCKSYFFFLKDRFESTSIDELVKLSIDNFIENISFYRASKLHTIVDFINNDMLNHGIGTLFNGNYYSEVLELVGVHFQKNIEPYDIIRPLKKEISSIVENKNISDILQNEYCFKYSKALDTIFKVKTLKTKIKELKIKHNIIKQ